MTPSKQPGERLVARIVDPGRPLLHGPTLVVLAHPDDETLACGALLPRCADLTIVHVTDGAPASGEDARAHGFASPAAYAAARRDELRAALVAGAVKGARLVEFGLPDQGAAHALVEIARRLVPLVRAAERILTHAYEGGHPDHDACAFAVRAAMQLGFPGGEPVPPVVEMPLYRAGLDGGWARQSSADAAVLRLTPEERRRKGAMLDAHVSQAGTLASFGAADEPYRVAAREDFARPPNEGRVLYDTYPWGLTGDRFVELAAAAARELAPPVAA